MNPNWDVIEELRNDKKAALELALDVDKWHRDAQLDETLGHPLDTDRMALIARRLRAARRQLNELLKPPNITKEGGGDEYVG